ncbi:alpha/beta fold hydrolase [Microlunatus sp. Y2014]|uniref:alpha/beta fold hydrolase n=1 Tax=Microlunatus sp. Y2014 TaxID=3418488 RepID=UPI003DA7A1BD
MTEAHTKTLAVDGAVLTYDLHGDPTSAVPLLVLGSPMQASFFGPLVAELGDRPVITLDCRGTDRSRRDDPSTVVTPEEHAADLHLVATELGLAEVDAFATSGAAVNCLAWVEAGGPIRTLVAHEGPILSVLPDREQATAAWRRILDAYDADGLGAGMARFLQLVMHEGPITEADVSAPTPDPAMFGLPTTDDGDRTDPLLGQFRPCTFWEPNPAALRDADTRIVIGVGEQSRDTLTGRSALAQAELLGLEPTWFPAGHDGFLSPNEHGMGGDPVAFGARLREVLASSVTAG